MSILFRSITGYRDTRRLIVILFVSIVLLGTSSQSTAHQQPDSRQSGAQATLPETPVGRTLRDFLVALNTGDIDVLKRFHREHRGNEANAEQDMGLYKESGGLKLARVDKASDYQIDVLVQAMRGQAWFKFGIEVEHNAPYGIISVRVEPTDGQPTVKEGTGSLATTAPRKLSFEEVAAELDVYLKKRVADDQFSGVVLIAREGKPVYQKAIGLASKEYNAPNLFDTRFNLGSINKVFTRIAIMQLVEKGQLSLADTIGKFLPEYPNKQAAEKVTVQQLLEMESGIGDFFGPKWDATPKNRLRGISDYLPLFADQPLTFEPGTRRAYSNGGYIVLGAIIEKVTRTTYYDYVRENIFKPAGMDATDAYQADENTPNLAMGYSRDAASGTRVSNIYSRPARGSSAGGGYSSAPDLLKFVSALQSNRLLSEQATRRVLGGGLGIAGGAPGINAALEVGGGYVIIVLANYDPPSAVEVSQKIRALLRLE